MARVESACTRRHGDKATRRVVAFVDFFAAATAFDFRLARCRLKRTLLHFFLFSRRHTSFATLRSATTIATATRRQQTAQNILRSEEKQNANAQRSNRTTARARKNTQLRRAQLRVLHRRCCARFFGLLAERSAQFAALEHHDNSARANDALRLLF